MLGIQVPPFHQRVFATGTKTKTPGHEERLLERMVLHKLRRAEEIQNLKHVAMYH